MNLLTTPPAVAQAMDSLSRSSSVERYIFGEGSSVVSQAEVVCGEAIRHDYITDEIGYKVIIILFIITYFIWIGRSLSNRANSSFRISNPFAKISESEGLVKSAKIGDVILDWSLVVVLSMLFTTRMVEMTQPYYTNMVDLAVHVNNLGAWLWMLLIATVFLAMLLWGSFIVAAGCYLMRRETMIRELFTLKSRMLKMSVVWVLPLVLLSSLEQENLVISYLVVLVAVMFVGIYIYRSCSLFMAQKISILHWILYLCAVEIFPITLIWAYFVR